MRQLATQMQSNPPLFRGSLASAGGSLLIEFAALFDGLDWTRVQTAKGTLASVALCCASVARSSAL
jgi:hypothetical protein